MLPSFQTVSEAVKERIIAKTGKLNEDSFGRFNEDWLLVYENLSLPGLQEAVASGYLAIALNGYWRENSFHRVFVETGHSIIEFTASSIQTHEIYDLW